MLGWTQALRGRCLDEATTARGLDTIERNVKVQARLIEDLLDVSRIIAGKLRLELGPLDLTQVVERSIDVARVAAQAKAIGLDAHLTVLPAVLGDSQRIEQIVSNLLSNAVKFTPPGGHIRVSLESTDGTARIVVADDGRGVAPELLPRLFDRFLQAESATVRRAGGLGLGLTIVRHLAEAHGGTAIAESSGIGRGATFTVTLPLVGATRTAVSKGLEPQRGVQPRPATDLGGLRVLVVDDDLDACNLLEHTLHDAGADVHTASSARAALAELDSFHPQVLLSDIGMPEEDGYGLIRQIRERELADGSHIPAVALTAFASPADRQQALAMGFDAHVAKPASPADLASVVARLAAAPRAPLAPEIEIPR